MKKQYLTLKPTKFELTLVKDAGQIRVNANYNCQNSIFLDRVNVLEIDANGSTTGAFTTVIRDYFGPGSGGNFLFAHMPSGTNVRQVKANGFYIEIDQLAVSNTVPI